ncbi:MAG: hypothetical protein K2F99_06960 [Muribaculaceae bacterium]|nr:hypothetical protein [Bacteroidales bacterium]MDE6041300.1 hypothetical protein [Muribaculaceae bacterium]
MLDWFKRYFSPITIGGIVIIGYVIFSGDTSIGRSIEHERTIDSLTLVLEANRDTMLYYRELNERLQSDPTLMEQVVREQYGMKKANEDVFTFEEPKK